MDETRYDLPLPPVDEEEDDGGDDDGVECCTCGVYFESPVLRFRRKDHQVFHCPNGHSMHFEEKTNEDVLTEELTKERNLRIELENKLCGKKAWWARR